MTPDDYMTVTFTVGEWEVIGEWLLTADDPMLVEAGEEIVGLLPAEAPQAPAKPERLTGAMVREVITQYKFFTIPEIVAELGFSRYQVDKFVEPMILSGVITQVDTVGNAKLYTYVKPDPVAVPRPSKVPPERDKPAYTEARATGEPIRITTERKDRRGRSTPGQRQKILNRDRAWERQQEAAKKSMEAQIEKAKRAGPPAHEVEKAKRRARAARKAKK